ncbi:MarR family winged helix-turn-helix transcriptional regulator [Aliirhizobium smilacinae]|nr:MarR family winged helix-turn-helix transcriptional regulator [Rhizobium smilacinae]
MTETHKKYAFWRDVTPCAKFHTGLKKEIDSQLMQRQVPYGTKFKLGRKQDVREADEYALDNLLREGGLVAAGNRRVEDLVAVKLWQNPCWLSFRINFLALQFNEPIYRRFEKEYGLPRPEFVVLYSLGLSDGLTASAICSSSGFPKNTISRAIQKLIDKKIIRREVDQADLRSFVLYITDEGRRIVDQAMQPMVEREKAMASALTPAEQLMLSELLAKIVVDSPNWPSITNIEENEE